MSTKIYNGIKFKSNSFYEVLEQLRSIKKESVDIGNSKINNNNIEWFIKGYKLQDKDPFEICDIIKTDINSTTRKDYGLDYNFSVILYPSKDGNIYGYYFSEIHEYENLLKLICDDFCYYNNTDQPDNISDDEWIFRCNKWEELIPDDRFDNGFKYQLVGSNDINSQSIRNIIRDILPSLKRDIKIDQVLDETK